jgi:hypothetical protein
MVGTHNAKALAVPSLFSIATIAILAPVAQAHEHDTTQIPEGETVSLEPLVCFVTNRTWNIA